MNTFTLGLIMIAYLLSLVYLGFLGYKKTTNTSDCLVGGRQMNPIVMALPYGATFTPASAIVGFGGAAVAFGTGIQWLCFLNMFVGVVIAFIFFGLRTRRMGAKLNVSTFPQSLGRHFRSYNIQVFIAAVIFIGMLLYAAVVMRGGAVFIKQISQIDFNISLLTFTLVIAAYVIAGGMKGVMHMDALQTVIMLGCILFLLFPSYQVPGMGFTEANKELTNTAPLVPEKFKVLGHQRWTATPVTDFPQWYSLVISLILGTGIGCLVQPQLVVRSMTIGSSRQLNRDVFIGCSFPIITIGATYHAGALGNLFFLKTEGAVATEVTQDIDKIIPYFINKAIPDWLAVLFMLCILSVSASTLSSQFHTMEASVGSDVYGTYKPRPCDKLTNVIRLGVLFFILISYIICYMPSHDIIARGTSIFMGTCAVVLFPTYFCALYWRKVTKQGVMASLRVGALGSAFALIFLHQKEAATMRTRKFLFGKDVLIETYPLSVIDPILFALPLSILAIVVVSLLTGRNK